MYGTKSHFSCLILVFHLSISGRKENETLVNMDQYG